MKSALVALLAVSFVVVAASRAGAEDAFNRPGPYVGLGANVRGGYRFNDFLAAEGLYEYQDEFGASRGALSRLGVGKSVDVQINQFTVNGKLLLPLGRFQPYLEGGVGFANANGRLHVGSRSAGTSGTNFCGRIGGGIDFWVTKNISLYGDPSYTMCVDSLSDLYYFNFGIGGRYNF
jgi:opacity protein-like surface antigen